MIARAPRDPRLRSIVRTLWCAPAAAPRATRELVLPTGTVHLVFRLDEPLRLFAGADDARGRIVGQALAGGARASAYLRDVSRPAASVGAQLLPGAAGLLLGVPAGALAAQHVALDAIWGAASAAVHERVACARSPEERLACFEAALIERIDARRAAHPAVVPALRAFDRAADVKTVVDASGMSHRAFVQRFREAVGLAPKLYCRVLRLQRVLQLRASSPARAWAELALEAGYSDQPHLCRDFAEMVGLSPRRYAQLACAGANHVPIA